MSRSLETVKREVGRIRLRFLIALPLVIACMLISRAHILAVGGSFDLPLPDFAGREITAENVHVDPPGVVQVGKIWQDEQGVPHITFEAGEPGKGFVTVGTEDMGMLFEMQTTESGIVVGEGFNVTGWEYVCVSLIAVVACLGVLCTSAAFSLWRRSWYGYEMAAYSGGALFFLLQAVQFAVLFLSGQLTSFAVFAASAIMMMNSFVDMMAVPMVLVALFVSASNVVLLRREGKAFTNLLGVIASILWAAAFLGIRAFHESMFLIIENPFVYIFADSVLAGILAYALALFFGVCLTALLAARHVPSFPRNHIIILGCGLRSDGTPTPLLAGRVDAAIAFAERQQEAGFSAPAFVPSGGQGSDEACSEASSMARYIEKHAQGPRILPEDRSTTTRENMAFSARVIDGDSSGAEPSIAFSTTNYHVLRGYVFAHQAGMAAEGIAAPTKLYFWPNAFLREFVGMLAVRALPIAMNCLAIISLYAALEFLLLSR